MLLGVGRYHMHSGHNTAKSYGIQTYEFEGALEDVEVI